MLNPKGHGVEYENGDCLIDIPPKSGWWSPPNAAWRSTPFPPHQPALFLLKSNAALNSFCIRVSENFAL